MKAPYNDLLYPRSRYHGQMTPSSLIFNANLQEFSQRVSFISGLETGGKITPNDAFNQIELLWEKLKQSHEQLTIDE